MAHVAIAHVAIAECVTDVLTTFTHVLTTDVLTTELTADGLAQLLVEHRTAVREVAGSNLDRTNTQGL